MQEFKYIGEGKRIVNSKIINPGDIIQANDTFKHKLFKKVKPEKKPDKKIVIKPAKKKDD